EIAICSADLARRVNIEPRVAMLSFSNFGSTKHLFSEKVKQATEIVKKKRPDIIIDGEMQADTAVVPEIIKSTYPFCEIKDGANVLIFPDLQSGNIAYKLMQRLGGAEAIGPILMGMKKSVHVLQREAEINDIVNMASIAVVDAQGNE
ncbi:MAG: Malate oxidoreductase, NADP-dependent, phosphate acetyltransferase-like protein domain-containing, partial [Candidatus Gottesmanbacteria bacterium GW2011_GWC2_39_8]